MNSFSCIGTTGFNFPQQTRITSYKNLKLLIAIGVISFIGGLLATVACYASLGSFSFIFVGGGLMVSTVCLIIGEYFLNKGHEASQLENTPPLESREATAQNSPSQLEERIAPLRQRGWTYQERAAIFQETLEACHHGYEYEGAHVTVHNALMLQHTGSYQKIGPLPELHVYQTLFSVINDDTFNVLLSLRRSGFNPVGINMANLYYPGGGVESGCPAQEEALCRRSNHILGLKTQSYPISESGGIYCPHVQVFRNDELHLYTFMEEPLEVALVAVAAYDLRPHSSERAALNLPCSGPINAEVLNDNEPYMNGMKTKIRNMLRIMSLKGHLYLVLGALGCGAFNNPPEVVSKLFLEIFREPEFQGRFERVDFAILNLFPKDQANVTAFTEICTQLNRL